VVLTNHRVVLPEGGWASAGCLPAAVVSDAFGWIIIMTVGLSELRMNKRETGQPNTGLFAQGENILNFHIKLFLTCLVCHASHYYKSTPLVSTCLNRRADRGAFDRLDRGAGGPAGGWLTRCRGIPPAPHSPSAKATN
jgi:hypothetical protein